MTGASEMLADEYFLAGQLVPSGIYREVNTGRLIRLEERGFLPTSLDGRVGAYVFVSYTWQQNDGIQRRSEDIIRPSRCNRTFRRTKRNES